MPAKLAALGFAANAKPIPGTRSSGLLYNYLPWLLATIHEQGNPQPEPHLEIIVTDSWRPPPVQKPSEQSR